MSDIDAKALETNFDAWRAERVPELKKSEAFEKYAAEQVLKDWDLDDDEIEYGTLGGEDDGGVDRIYLLMNGRLLQDDSDVSEDVNEVDLILIQAKNEATFKEDVLQKLESFTRDLLDYSKAPTSFTYLNSRVRDSIGMIRDKYNQVIGRDHTIHVQFHYVTRSANEPLERSKVKQRGNLLEAFVRSKISNALTSVTYWGAVRTLAAARRSARVKGVIDAPKYLTTADGSIVCLTKLASFARFITNDKGHLLTSILEPNVRDYQGQGNPVNRAIRGTLESPRAGEEFWWLNNGITVLASGCAIVADKITIEEPEVVNGLQTSHEIFNYFQSLPAGAVDDRHVLVRIIVPADEASNSNIIKATNSQTKVDDVQLRSTERIHFDIEEKLRLYDLFYDRRKGKYKRLRKPIKSIVSIDDMAKAVMSILLQRPNDARARPRIVIRSQESYLKMFGEDFDRDLYLTCIMIDRQVKSYLDSHKEIPQDTRRNVRFYTDMLTAMYVTGSERPTEEELVAAKPACIESLDQDIADAVALVTQVYEAEGANDIVAKGPTLKSAVLKAALKDR